MSDPSGRTGVEPLLRELAPLVLGATVRRWRDFAAAEDAVQEALIAATEQWPREGVPANPRGWLIQVASRRMTDNLRSERARRAREEAVAAAAELAAPGDETTLDRARDADLATPGRTAIDPEDDTLVLLFMCCHPALSPASAIALTLRAVGGLTTAEIAQAYLVPEATMAQRISRAKQQVKASGVPFRLPDPGERARRLASVLHVLYLVFSEGYTASSGAELHRTDLSGEAIRLTRGLHALLAEDAEVTALLALMLLTDARRAARTGPAGELVPLNEQDRTLWDRTAIDEGTALVREAWRSGTVGEYQLQAAVAAVHDSAARAEDTDWPEILALYGVLERLSDNPMVALNRAIAAAEVHGPEAGLELLRALDGDPRVRGHFRLDAVRAHLLERTGDVAGAVALYLAAAEKTTSVPERDYLQARAARLRQGSG